MPKELTGYGKVLMVYPPEVHPFGVRLSCVVPTAFVYLSKILLHTADGFTRIRLSIVDKPYMDAPMEVWSQVNLNVAILPYMSFIIDANGERIHGVEIHWSKAPRTPNGIVDEMYVLIPLK